MDTSPELAPGELPPLPPEMKIEMKLDDIIKYERARTGISHNMNSTRPYRRRQQRRRPFRSRMWGRYRSQNWRLRGNGPNTPYWQRQSVGRITAFLRRKWASTPFNSVFQRLGWNSTLEAAKSKLHIARNFRRPTIKYPYYKTYMPIKNDPNRIKKLFASAQHYRKCNGLNGLTMDSCTGGMSQSLNESNLAKLSEVFGGPISSIKESDNGSVFTIVRAKPESSNVPCNPFQESTFNQFNYQPGNHAAYSNQPFNQAVFSNQRFNQSFSSNHLNPMIGNYYVDSNGPNRAISNFPNRNSVHSMNYSNFGETQSADRNGAQEDYTSPLLRNRGLIFNNNIQRNTDTPPPLIGENGGFFQANRPDVDERLPVFHATNMTVSNRFGNLPAFVQNSYTQ